MKIEEAKVILDEVCNVPFGELFKNHPNDLITNKGKVGQLLLIYIGIGLDSNLCDFEDGELKTNKSDKHGHPLETMFITQISAIIDELVIQPPKEFESSNLFIKIKNLIYLPVVKESENCSNWYFTNCFHVDLENNKKILSSIKSDYYTICEGLKNHVETSADGFIHTTNGQFIQIRSKDSKPYHPIKSAHYGRYISDKNHAFYFKKDFMKEILKQNS